MEVGTPVVMLGPQFPMMVYHPVKEAIVVGNSAELAEAERAGYGKDMNKLDGKGLVKAKIKWYQAEIAALECELGEVEQEHRETAPASEAIQGPPPNLPPPDAPPAATEKEETTSGNPTTPPEAPLFLCGKCGKPFASERSAKLHERLCKSDGR